MSKEIIICEGCDGKGLIERNECTSHHNGDYDYWDEKCEKCQGSGRIVRKIITQIIDEPFELPPPKGGGFSGR